MIPPIGQVRRNGLSRSPVRKICHSCQEAKGLISANELAQATGMARTRVRQLLGEYYTGSIPFAVGRPTARDAALIAAAQADVPLLDTATGGATLIPEEGRGGSARGAGSANTTAACGASPGIQELTYAVMEDSEFRELRADHRPCNGGMVDVLPFTPPLARQVLLVSPPVHHAVMGSDVCRVPRYLREDRVSRLVAQRDALGSEREALGEKLRAEVDTSNGLRSRLLVLSKELAAMRADAARLQEEGDAYRLELGVMRQELAVERNRCLRVEGDRALLNQEIAKLRKSGELRRLLRDSQLECGRLERELRSLKEDTTRRGSELAKLREELSGCQLRARSAEEARCALSNECARLRVVLELREEKAAQEADLRRRHPFFYEHMDFLRKKAGLGEENSPPYPHRGKLGDSDIDWHAYYVLMSQIGEYH